MGHNAALPWIISLIQDSCWRQRMTVWFGMCGGLGSANILSPYLGRYGGALCQCAEPHPRTTRKVIWRGWWLRWRRVKIQRASTWTPMMVPLLEMVLLLIITSIPIVPCHPEPYSFLQNIAEVLYHLWLKPDIPWGFEANGFCRACVDPNFKPYNCPTYPKGGKELPFFKMISSMIFLASTGHEPHLRCLKSSI